MLSAGGGNNDVAQTKGCQSFQFVSWKRRVVDNAWDHKSDEGSPVILLVMDAEDASFRHPLLALGCDELPDSVLADELQVLDLAHAVFREVALVEVAQPAAWEFRAMTTELAGAFLADAQLAVHSGLGLVLFSVPTAVAGVMLAQEGLADAAIHAAGSDHVLGDWVFHAEGPGANLSR